MAIKTTGTIVKVNDKDTGDLQSFGGVKQKRNVKEYEAINTGVIVQAIGNVKTDPITMSVLYNPADSAGAKELENAFNSGTIVPFSIELPDTAGTNGTTFSWDGAVISDFEVNPEADGYVLASFTASLNGAPTVTEAS